MPWAASQEAAKRAGITKRVSPHLIRDAFAVDMLMSGVPLERVRCSWGTSIRVTEKHYAPWIHARQEQLEADLELGWATDPIVLAETKSTAIGTREKLRSSTN